MTRMGDSKYKYQQNLEFEFRIDMNRTFFPYTCQSVSPGFVVKIPLEVVVILHHVLYNMKIYRLDLNKNDS